MIETSDLIAFTRVVELESLTLAAQALGVPKSTISRKLTRLEAQLGAQLMRRTTRGVSPTEQGVVFYDYAARCLGVLRDGANAVQVRHRHPRGVLRIAITHELDLSVLAPLLTDYLASYPEVRLTTALTDASADHFRQGFDLAIVADTLPLAEASTMTTRLGATAYGLFAAPGYLERNGAPQSHVDLPRFDLLAWGNTDAKAQWSLSRDADNVTVEFRPRLVCNDLTLLRHAALAGLGIASLPVFLGDQDSVLSRLVTVLPEWRPRARSFYAVFPQAQAMPMRVRAFIDFLVERLRPALSR